MAKKLLVTFEERKLQSLAPDETLQQLEGTLKRIIQEINLTNGLGNLWVVSVEDQQS
jgi:hypothetical protein